MRLDNGAVKVKRRQSNPSAALYSNR